MTEINLRLKKKLNEVFSIEPNDLGIDFITFYFKKITAYFKTIPFVYVIPFIFLISLFLFLFLVFFLLIFLKFLHFGF